MHLTLVGRNVSPKMGLFSNLLCQVYHIVEVRVAWDVRERVRRESCVEMIGCTDRKADVQNECLDYRATVFGRLCAWQWGWGHPELPAFGWLGALFFQLSGHLSENADRLSE